MHAILRPYATAGVVIAGTGLIAATPVAAPAPAAPAVIDVALTGLPGIVDTWQDVFNTASANATTLLNNYMLAPGVAWQQLFANWMGYTQQFLDDPSSSTLADINTQIQDRWVAVRDGWAVQDMLAATKGLVTQHTLDGAGLTGHAFLYNQLPSFLPPDIDAESVTAVVDWLTSPLSAVIIGSLGPGISPWVAMMNSIDDGDGFSEIIANTWGGFLNGATLSLDFLLPMINDAGFLPVGMSLDHLEFAFGGLLTPGSVSVGPYEVLGTGGEVVASIPAVGGSIFNGIGLEMVGVPLLNTIAMDGQAIGPIAAWEAWGQIVGALLGSGWSGKGAVVVTPPMAGVELPVIPDDLFDDGGASAEATNVFSGLQDLLDDIFS
ncbi:outer membrane porin GjpA [[Mycobacterium] kokjensenii]|uniref:Outer membrane porin GjpA n=1 Tax=[Mycobacterium] kokjensenii TaxID=3064287 RepID=A0ABM9LVI6_9MYCO|nr:outer membrane porin GjpA [Mycolicibacter sp. MU0083]CAJ1505429.1 outer membrane porin GjpA [Mycolicibacter sp. MU0083]